MTGRSKTLSQQKSDQVCLETYMGKFLTFKTLFFEKKLFIVVWRLKLARFSLLRRLFSLTLSGPMSPLRRHWFFPL